MAAPTTVDQALQLVRRSGLVDSGRLASMPPQPAESPKKYAQRLIAAGLLTAFQAEQILLGKWRGFTLGKFKVLERIGCGGNGTVYLCEHTIVRRKVAIKVLPKNKADNPTALTRFYREARAAGALDHPHLVKAHDVDHDHGLHFLVMEYIDGGNLQDVVARCGPLAPARAANYIAQAACGLEGAHVAGLVHRDVKPANMILDRHGIVRVSDLGLARFFCDGKDPLTLRHDENAVLGTADYVAPEQAVNSHEVDARADIYSLGGTFCFLLTGKPPFPGGKAGQKLIWHQVRTPASVRKLRPEVPEEMAAIVARMLAKDPKERFQTAYEVNTALAPWAQQPVPTPTEAELPLLSPAARGGGDVSPSSATLQRTRLAPLQGMASATNSSQIVRGRDDHSATATATHALPGAPMPLTQAETPSSLAADVATQSEDSPPPAPEVISPVRRAGARNLQRGCDSPAARARAQSLRLAAILVVGLLGAAALRWTNSRPAAAPASVPTLIVAHGNSPGTFSSLAEALAHARPGARIVLRADSWEEALEIPGTTAVSVTIEGQAPSGGPVRWRPPQGHPADRPLLKVHGRADLTLSGITLDGENRLSRLVVLAGPCPGLTLRQLYLTGFRETGLTLRSFSGSPENPAILERLRVRPGRGAEAALAIDAPAYAPTAHVEVRDCRLEGPYQAAVVIAGPTLNLTLARNRLYQSGDGLLYRKTILPHPVGLALVHNTFYGMEKSALHFETTPSGGKAVVAANLFARTETLIRVDGAGIPAGFFAGSSGNVCDKTCRGSRTRMEAAVLDFDLCDDAGDDARFLRCPLNGALTKAGFPGVPSTDQARPDTKP
jgi:serine/threonine protein kinase